jgi:anti-sigma-K factor RskA
VILGGSWITLDQARSRLDAEQEAAALSEVVATMDRVLAEEHAVVQLRAPDGSSAGSISWSRHDWVVLTSALAEPAAGQVYRCWLEDDNGSLPIGEMEFAGGTAYWVAAVDDWQTWEIGPTTRFVVSRETGDAPSRTGEIVLSADLNS